MPGSCRLRIPWTPRAEEARFPSASRFGLVCADSRRGYPHAHAQNCDSDDPRAARFRSSSAVQAARPRPRTCSTNPDFDGPGGLDLWTVQTGSAVLGADSGSCTTSGAVDATSGLSFGGGDQLFWITSQQCILVDGVANPVMHLAGMYRTTANVFSRIYLQLFSDASCLAPVGFSVPLSLAELSAAWNRLAGTVAIDSATMAVRVWVETYVQTSGGPAFTVQWDRFYFGVLPEIFLDDFEFESGSACRWSAAVGGI